MPWTETETETERERETETERERERETERSREKQRETERDRDKERERQSIYILYLYLGHPDVGLLSVLEVGDGEGTVGVDGAPTQVYASFSLLIGCLKYDVIPFLNTCFLLVKR